MRNHPTSSHACVCVLRLLWRAPGDDFYYQDAPVVFGNWTILKDYINGHSLQRASEAAVDQTAATAQGQPGLGNLTDLPPQYNLK
jgi:hypothetical protein